MNYTIIFCIFAIVYTISCGCFCVRLASQKNTNTDGDYTLPFINGFLFGIPAILYYGFYQKELSISSIKKFADTLKYTDVMEAKITLKLNYPQLESSTIDDIISKFPKPVDAYELVKVGEVWEHVTYGDLVTITKIYDDGNITYKTKSGEEATKQYDAIIAYFKKQ